MEKLVQVSLANEAAIKEQEDMISRHRQAAETGDKNAERIVDDASARLDRLSAQRDHLTSVISEQSGKYQSITAHPHPDIDKRGGRQEDAAERARHTRKEVVENTALLLGGAAALGAKGATTGAVMAAGTRAASAATTYSRALRQATADAMKKSGVDLSDQKAVTKWVKENPDLAAENTRRAIPGCGTGIRCRQTRRCRSRPCQKSGGESCRQGGWQAHIRVLT